MAQDAASDYVVWDQKMSVGVDVLDGDHRRLLDLFNALLRTGVSKKSKDDLSALLKDLQDYVDVHFTREEQYMDRYGFPDAAAHKAAHRYFIDELAKLQQDFEGSDVMMLRIDLILLLKEWFIEHIQSTDMQYKPYMTA